MAEAFGVSAAASKLLSGVVARQVGVTIQRPMARWSTGRTVSKAARRSGLHVTTVGIVRWLGRADTQKAIRVGNGPELASSTRALAVIAFRSGAGSEDQVEALFQLILVELTQRGSPKDAAVLTSTRTVTEIRRAEAATRTAIANVQASILDTLDAPKQFEEDLRSIPPLRRGALREASASWPGFHDLVRSLVSANDRSQLLADWAAHPPMGLQDMGSPPWLALALLAFDHDANAEGRTFLDEAISRGAAPRAYWLARAALKAKDHSAPIPEGATDHPLGAAVERIRAEDLSGALAVLEIWMPDTQEDEALKAILVAQVLAGREDVNGAIAKLDEYNGPSSGLQLLLAHLLLGRARYGGSTLPTADAERALQAAISARDARRLWRGPSAEAVIVAVQASLLASDHPRAWALTLQSPYGEATPEEAGHPEVRREALAMATLQGDLAASRRIVGNSQDPYELAILEAAEAAARNEPAVAFESLSTAYALAKSDAARLGVAYMLAYEGGPMPDLSGISDAYSGTVEEVKAVSNAVHAAEGDMASLRTLAVSSRAVTVLLAEKLTDQTKLDEAAEVLTTGGDRWNDPVMMRMAAARYLAGGNHDAARVAAESAIVLGGDKWAGEFDARALLLEALEGLGEAEAVESQARRLVSLRPESADARWALVSCQLRSGDVEGAWGALTPQGVPIAPRNANDAKSWIGLVSKFDHSPHFLGRALEQLKRWEDDEVVAGVFLLRLVLRTRDDEHPMADSDLITLKEATDKYTDLFPESPVFRAIEIDPERPWDAITDLLRSRAEASEGLGELVQSGRAPVGVLSWVGRGYAHAVAQGLGGAVRAHDPRVRTAEATAAALNGVAVLDTTAAATLAGLSDSVVDTLLGNFRAVESTDAGFRDALDAQEELGLRSTFSAVWDREAQAPRPVVLDEAEAERRAQRADRIVSILARTRRRHWSQLENLELENGDNQWLSALDVAVTTGGTLWCDDLALRGLAHSLGATTVCTYDLVGLLASRQTLTEDECDVIVAELISQNYVDLPFTPAAFKLAVALDADAPKGAAFALSRANAWSNPAVTLQLAMEVLDRVAEHDPEHLRLWIGAIALGLVRVAGEPQAATGNLEILLGRLIARPWISGATLPWVLQGVRGATQEFPGIADPTGNVLANWLRVVTDELGPILAANLLMAMFNATDTEDRALMARTILLAG